jgi:diguanylate cyclase (GGDEF)-like protein
LGSIRLAGVLASQDSFEPDIEFLGELGRGAGTIVSRVRRRGVDYALKMPTAPVAYEEQESVNFRREAAMLACVTHRGLPRIFEAGYARDRPFIIMDLVDGESLEDVLAKGRLQEAQAAAIATDVAGALAAAHRAGLVHRDVKPKNIMILPSGPAKLIDFGLARWSATEKEDSVSGTFSYMAPEQTGMLKRVVDGRGDLYSLGVTLFQCLTGQLPFVSSDAGELMRMHTVSPAPQVRELRPDVSPVMEAIVARLLAKDPDDRYQSGEGLVADLQGLRTDGGDTLFALGSSEAVVGAVQAPLVGRGAELDELLVRWDKARAGQGGAVLVSCTAGGGKSRLVQEFLAICGDEVAVLHGKSAPDEAVPLAPLRAAVEEHLSAVKGLAEPARSAALERVRAAAQPVALIIPTLSPAVAELIEARQVPGENMQEQFTNAVASFLVGLAQQAGGAILYLDDVQWLDAGTWRVLRRLAGELAQTPLLVITTARDDDDNREAVSAGLDRVIDTRIALAPLDDAAAGELIAEHLGGVALAPALTARLASRCGGNPLMISEYVRAIVDAGLLRPSWGVWVLEERGLDALALPGDVLALIGSRVHGLGADSRRVLAAAAAIGMGFGAELLAAVCGLDERSVQEAIRVAIDRRLVVAAESGGYGFAHDRIREALLADADEPSLRALHQRIARAVEASPAVGSEQVYAVARHYLRGQTDRTPDRAFAACLAAGELALAEYAPQEALQYLLAGNAVGVIAGIDAGSRFHTTLGLAYLRAGRFDEAMGTLSRALNVESDANRRGMLHELIAEIHQTRTEPADAVEVCLRGLAELSQRLPTNRILLVLSSIALFARGLFTTWSRLGFGNATGEYRETCRLMTSLMSRGAQNSAVPTGDRLLMGCLNLRQVYPASRLGISLEYVRVYTNLAAVLRIAGMRRQSIRLFRRMRERAGQVGDPRALTYVDWMDGIVRAVWRRDEIDAARILRRVLTEHRWLDATEHLVAAHALCTSLTFCGYPLEAKLWHDRVLSRVGDLRQARGAGFHTSGAAYLAMLGQSEDAAGELSTELSKSFLSVEEPGQWDISVAYVMIALMAAVEQSQVGEEFETRVAQMRQLRLTPRRAIPMWWQMWISLAQGRLAQLAAATEKERPARLEAARQAIRQIPRGRRSRFIVAHRLILEATLRQATGDSGDAFRFLEKAERTARGLDAPILEYDIARVRARALRSVGYDAEAHRQAGFALKLAEEYGWQHRVRWIRSEFGIQATERHTLASASSQLNLRRLDALQEVSSAAATVLDQRELARVALDKTLRIVGAERAFLFLIDDESAALVPQLGRDASGTELTSLTAYATTLVEQVRATGQPLVVTGDEKGHVSTSESAVAHGLLSIMVAPVLLRGALRGVVYLDSRAAKGVFTGEDVDILMAIVNQVAISLETAHAARLEVAVQATRQQRDLAETLRVAMARMSQTLVPAEVLRLLLETSARTAHAEAACLLRREDESLVLSAVTGNADQAAVGTTINPTRDPTLAAMVDAATAARGTVTAAHPAPLPQILTAIRSWIALPLVNRTEMVGIVLAGASRPDAYTEADVEVQAALAGQGMVAYENARLFYLARRQAVEDGLTGIYNRRHLLERAAERFATARTRQQEAGALMIDIDHFKQVNDQYGHAIGDEVLRQVATKLRSQTRDGDLIGRYGGEEFVVFVTSGADGANWAERLRAAVAATPIITPAGEIRATVSIGVAGRRPEDADLDALLIRADAALYQAKHQGRNRVVTA